MVTCSSLNKNCFCAWGFYGEEPGQLHWKLSKNFILKISLSPIIAGCSGGPHALTLKR